MQMRYFLFFMIFSISQGFSLSSLKFYKAHSREDSVIINFSYKLDLNDNSDSIFTDQVNEFDLNSFHYSNSFFWICDRYGWSKITRFRRNKAVNFVDKFYTSSIPLLIRKRSYFVKDSIVGDKIFCRLILFPKTIIKKGLFRKKKFVLIYLRPKNRKFLFNGSLIDYFVSNLIPLS